ncbi:MAG: nicotinate-nucleotide--dimethylbenzimidazole phosphoribosyltransferase [Ferruginibacter sp.]
MKIVSSEQLQHKIDQKTKPRGSLGMLECLAVKVGLIQNNLVPAIINPHILIIAADHGIATANLVNNYPQEVTAQMVNNFVKGGGAINIICRHSTIALAIVDAGVNADFEENMPIIHAKIRKGTTDYRQDNAMSIEEVNQAMELGKAILNDIVDTGCNTIGFGEMGIGNTSSAALIMHHILKLPVADCAGRGAGANDEQLQLKINILQQVSEFHELALKDFNAVELLSKIGGFEIAMMTGTYLEAYQQNMVIVVDGFIATAALLLAMQINSKVLDNCIFAHTSKENGHTKMLEYLNASPLLELNMRLGEGTGAALAIPIIQSSVHLLNEMASFESAHVTEMTSA